MILTGKQVKTMAKERDWMLVKFLPFSNLKYDTVKNPRTSYKYKYGLNVPAEPINLDPESIYSTGGLHFTYISLHTKEYNLWANGAIYSVSVPDDAMVLFYEPLQKFKTDRLIIECEWPDELYLSYSYLNWLVCLNIQTEEICIREVSRNPISLLFVQEQTEEICKTAVAKNGLMLRLVKPNLRTNTIIQIAVEQDPLAAIFINQ
jgi:hypothetical protein